MPSLTELSRFCQAFHRDWLRDLVLYGSAIQLVVPDEFQLAFEPLKEPVMTEVTAVASKPVSNDVYVRPPLPEGVRYLFDDCDRVTTTDVSGAPEGAFRPLDAHGYHGYLYRHGMAEKLDVGNTDLDLAARVRRESVARVHIFSHPTNAAYNTSPSYSDHPLNFSGYQYQEGHPWKHAAFWQDNWLRWAEHMPAPSMKHPGLLMYFQSPEKRARDIRTPIKPGKYLTKFFSDVLTGEEINNYAVMWTNMSTPPKLSVTNDADEIERLYRGKKNGSCMHFGGGGFDGDEHPARVYASPDVAQAYIGDIDNADARCLVWPDKMIFYPKFYGDYRRLQSALEAAGYRSADEAEFCGARLDRIPYGRAFIAPYLDVCGYVQDRGDWLTIEFDGIPCRETEGLTKSFGKKCAYSGEYCDEDEMTYVDGYGHVSDVAYREYFGECELTGNDYHQDALTYTENGYNISDYAMASSRYSDRWFRCEYSDEVYLVTGSDRPVTLPDGTVYHIAHATRCEFSDEYYPDNETTVLDNGRVVADDLIDEADADYRAFAGLTFFDSEVDQEIREVEAA